MAQETQTGQWTGEPGGLQSIGSQRVGHDCLYILLARMRYLYAFVLEVAVWVYVVMNTPSIQFIGFSI